MYILYLSHFITQEGDAYVEYDKFFDLCLKKIYAKKVS